MGTGNGLAVRTWYRSPAVPDLLLSLPSIRKRQKSPLWLLYPTTLPHYMQWPLSKCGCLLT